MRQKFTYLQDIKKDLLYILDEGQLVSYLQRDKWLARFLLID